MSRFSDPVIMLMAAMTLAAVFGIATVAKLRALPDFAAVVQNFHILPGVVARPFAYALPLVELSVAFGLLFETTRGWAAAGALVLLSTFTLAIAVNLARGRREIDCGCFGPSHRQILSGWLVGRNAVLMLLAAICLGGDPRSRPMDWFDLVTSFGGAATLALLYFAANDLLAVARPTSGAHQRSA